MPKKYRIVFQVFFTLFFFIFAAFLLTNSFGYRFNPATRTLEYNATIEVRTAPFDADIQVKNTSFNAKTPEEISISRAGTYEVEVKKEGYLTENLSIYFPGQSNQKVTVNPLYLLPTRPTISFSLPGTVVAVLDDTQLLIRQDADLQVVAISPAGILSTQKVSSTLPSDVNKLDTTKLSNSSFWLKASNTILEKQNNTWRLTPLPREFATVTQVISASGFYYALNSSGELWSLNSNGGVEYVDSGVKGLASLPSPPSIWVWKDDWLQKLNQNSQLATEIKQREASFQSSQLLEEKGVGLKVKTVFQGYIFQLGTSLYFHSDFDGGDFVPIAKDVLSFDTASDTIYWQNNSTISFLNVRSLARGIVTDQVPSQTKTIWYDEFWNRLFVQTNNALFTTWHDNDVSNTLIANYPLQLWLSENCSKEQTGGTALCTETNRAIYYINRDIVF